jgi:4-hydroxyphenylacetate 3-monooxygenase
MTRADQGERDVTTSSEALKTTVAPLTGEEYLESLRDGRRIYLGGELIDDVTAHPAFRNAAQMIARLYDTLHDPSLRDVVTRETDTGSGSRTHKYFAATRSSEELLGARDAIVHWSRMGFGFMGRTPDYKASFLATLGPNADYWGPFADNARRWYKEAEERNWYFNHVLLGPPVNRDKPMEASRDVFVRVTREVDGGFYVSGAKVVATGGPLTNFNFIAPLSMLPIKGDEFSVAFFLPVNAPGSSMICRASYEAAATSPFDYPLSSRVDENDAMLALDDVFVPWENTLFYRDPERARGWRPASAWVPRICFQACARLAVKFDFICGVLLKAIEATGAKEFRGVQVNAGEVIAWRDLFWSLSETQARHPDPGPGETVNPNYAAGRAYRAFAPRAWTRVREIVQDLVASGLIVMPSGAADFKNSELRPLLDRYYVGSGGYDAEQKVKLMKLLWDAIGTEFAGRHELYERNYAGNNESTTLDAYFAAHQNGNADQMKAFVQRCMDDYDLDGWKRPDLFN